MDIELNDLSAKSFAKNKEELKMILTKTSLVVQWSRLYLPVPAGVQVQPLVRGQRAHVPLGQKPNQPTNQPNKQTKNRRNIVTNSRKTLKVVHIKKILKTINMNLRL